MGKLLRHGHSGFIKKYSLLLFYALGFLPLFIQAQSSSNMIRRSDYNSPKANRIHFKSILVDTHNDIPTTAIDKGYSFDENLKYKTHSDLVRMERGGVDAQFFSIWCDGEKTMPYAWANRQIDTVVAWASRNPGAMMMAKSVSDIKKAARHGKLAALLGVEGGHMIENDINKLVELYNRGVRYMTLTWNNSTEWATSALDETTKADSLKHKGLTDFGKQIVHKMNELGMMVDVSHVGEQTFWDVIATTKKPVIASHSCVYALCAHRRNLKDEQIKAIAKNGGVIQLNFYSGFLEPTFEERIEVFLAKHRAETDSIRKANPDADFMHAWLFAKYPEESKGIRPSFNVLLDHLDYIVKLVGVDYVGYGSDFDGVGSVPLGIEGVEDFPKITQALYKKGYSKKDIKKILGGNLLRVFKANL